MTSENLAILTGHEYIAPPHAPHKSKNEIYVYDLVLDIGAKFHSMAEVSRAFDINKSIISRRSKGSFTSPYKGQYYFYAILHPKSPLLTQRKEPEPIQANLYHTTK